MNAAALSDHRTSMVDRGIGSRRLPEAGRCDIGRARNSISDLVRTE